MEDLLKSLAEENVSKLYSEEEEKVLSQFGFSSLKQHIPASQYDIGRSIRTFYRKNGGGDY